MEGIYLVAFCALAKIIKIASKRKREIVFSREKEHPAAAGCLSALQLEAAERVSDESAIVSKRPILLRARRPPARLPLQSISLFPNSIPRADTATC